MTSFRQLKQVSTEDVRWGVFRSDAWRLSQEEKQRLLFSVHEKYSDALREAQALGEHAAIHWTRMSPSGCVVEDEKKKVSLRGNCT